MKEHIKIGNVILGNYFKKAELFFDYIDIRILIVYLLYMYRENISNKIVIFILRSELIINMKSKF